MAAPSKGSGGKSSASERLVASNRKAFHDYEILETTEAGLVLSGTEVKSLRDGRANLKDSYVLFEKGAPILVGCHISAYEPGSYNNHEPERARKLLLHRRQLAHLSAAVQEKGLALVPLRIYFRGSWAKIEIALARGKKLHDKRQAEREKELDRETRAAIKEKVDRR